MKNILSAILLAFILFSGCMSSDEKDHYVCKVQFPEIAKEETECITEINATITCARFVAIKNIPNDWSISASAPSSEICKFKAACGHGSSAVWNYEQIRNVFDIRIVEPKLFDIMVKIRLASYKKQTERTIEFHKNDLILTR